MIELKDMNEEDRAMCEEWERLYTESGKQFSFEVVQIIFSFNISRADSVLRKLPYFL